MSDPTWNYDMALCPEPTEQRPVAVLFADRDIVVATDGASLEDMLMVDPLCPPVAWVSLPEVFP